MPPSSNNNLTLKIIFVILFLVLLGELGYVFVTVNKKNIATRVVPTSINTQNLDYLKPKVYEVLLVYFDNYQKKTIDILHSITEIEGVIAGFEEVNNSEQSVQKEIKDKNKKGLYQLFFYKDNNNIEVHFSSSKAKNIYFKDLKIGQKVKIIIQEDFTKRIYKSINITVLD